jgi:hypothetical protein
VIFHVYYHLPIAIFFCYDTLIFRKLVQHQSNLKITMGSIIRVWKTIPMPEGATVGRNGIVTWTVKGKKRTGKMSASGRVSIPYDLSGN